MVLLKLLIEESDTGERLEIMYKYLLKKQKHINALHYLDVKPL